MRERSADHRKVSFRVLMFVLPKVHGRHFVLIDHIAAYSQRQLDTEGHTQSLKLGTSDTRSGGKFSISKVRVCDRVMLSHILITFLYVLKSTLADVQLVSPASGASIAGGAVTLKWQDSGAKPALVAIKAADIILCTGTNAAPQLLDTVAAAVPLGSTTSLAVTIPLTIGATGQYFFKFVSTTAGGQVVTTFSNRFTLTGMTGTVVANTGLAAVGPAGTTPPAALTETAAAT